MYIYITVWCFIIII